MLYQIESGRLPIGAVNLERCHPVVIRVTEFTEAAQKAVEEGVRLTLNNGQPFLLVHIDSYGGNVDALNGMVSALHGSGLPVVTYVSSKANSCGAFLLGMGTPGLRHASPSAGIMLHQLSNSAGLGQTNQGEAKAKHLTGLNQALFEQLSRHCGWRETYFEDLLSAGKYADVNLTAQQAYDHGLVDYIGAPMVQVEPVIHYDLSLNKADPRAFAGLGIATRNRTA